MIYAHEPANPESNDSVDLSRILTLLRARNSEKTSGYELIRLIFEYGPDDSVMTFLLVAFASFADSTGFCYPGIPKLAHYLRKDERTILRVLNRLESEKWVEIRRKSVGPSRKGNSYVVNFNKLRAASRKGSPSKSFPEEGLGELGALFLQESEPASDAKTSCPLMEAPQVTNPSIQMTNSARSGDKTAPPIRKNCQELPTEQPKGTGARFPHLTGEHRTHATGMLERLAIMCADTTLSAAAESIRLAAKWRSLSIPDAMFHIEDRASLDIARGIAVNRFWFEDGRWKIGKGSSASVGMYSQAVAPEPGLNSTQQSAPVVSDEQVAAGRRGWAVMLKELETKVSPGLLRTWIHPIRPMAVVDGILSLAVPCEEYGNVDERYQFADRLPPGIESVRIVCGETMN